MTDTTREREQEASLTNKIYRVVYAKLGKKTFDEFSTIEEAIQDYEIKLSIDKEQYFDDRFELEWQRMTRIQKPLSLILLDIDKLELYNNVYGHQVGDDCLYQVAQVINSVIKYPDNLVARYSGKKFILLLPQIEAGTAILIAEEIRETVKSLRIKIPELTKKNQVTNMISLTISLGIACVIPTIDFSLTEFLEAAEKALYQANQLGCDCTILSSKFNFGYCES
jgi:diguanylate cyclase (GGDEF)-like protein